MLCLCALLPGVAPVSAAPAISGDTWLAYANGVRALANLPPVTENPAFSAADAKHSRYLVENQASGHDEDATKPFYSPDGADAGQNGIVFTGGSTVGGYDFRAAIDGWMTTPFHATGIINPRASQTGFGLYTSPQPINGFYQTAATMEAWRGLQATPTYPTMFPANGKTTPYTTFGGDESPDPLPSCAGYAAPTGAPIFLFLAGTPSVTATSLSANGAPLPVCEIDETTYTNAGDADAQQTGRNVLGALHVVVLLPRAPLVSGTTYSVSVTADQAYTWSFAVA